MSVPKVALLGNSHLGALARAYREAGGSSEVGFEATFYPVISSLLHDYKIEGQTLVPNDVAVQERFLAVGGSRCVDLAAYNFIVVVGHGVSLAGLDTMLRYATVETAVESRRETLVSKAVFKRIVENVLQERLGVRISRDILQVTGREAILVVEPVPARTQTEYEAYLAQSEAEKQKFIEISRIFGAALADSRQIPAVALLQPEETLCAAGSATRSEFVVGMEGLGERRHGNSAYGALVLKQIFAAIRAMDVGS